jgi:hypothetical protein
VMQRAKREADHVLRSAKVPVTKSVGPSQKNQTATAVLRRHLREVMRKCHDPERAVFLVGVAAAALFRNSFRVIAIARLLFPHAVSGLAGLFGRGARL